MEEETLLDLGHLTEAEQNVILDVLLRDNELRNQDEGRISKLKQVESDPVRLHFLTGAWFNEQRAKRYQNRGTDVVQTSMRRKRKDKDLPVMSVFEEQKEQNSSQRLEETTEVNTADLEDGEIIEKEKKIEEEKKESLNLSVAPEPRPRTKRSTKTNTEKREDISEVESREITEGSVADSEALEDRSLQNTTSSLQADSDGDIDSGSTELDYTRFGSVNNLNSNHTMSGSMMSLYSAGDFGSVTVTGQIQFSLQYDSRKEELHVRVCRCQDLAPARKNRSDPYVKLYLLPDNTSHSKRKTSVKKKTLNPVYDETLKYKVRKSDLLARVLSVSVWHMERVRRNLFLGEVEVQLSQWDWSQSKPAWYPLQPRVQMNPEAVLSRGTILLSIKFIPPGSEEGGFPLTGELHIWLKEIVGLLPPKRGTPSISVKSVILPDESGGSGQQTRVVRGSVSPVFNHTMVYDGLQSVDLTQACAEITVWNSSTCLGGVHLSTGSGMSYGQMVSWMDSNEEEISVWNTVIQDPNNWVDVTLPIRTNIQLC
ncbi:synaptotagmin-like protein 1 [Pangasianodon hypophthalmus]|uniref:synaptotagmin-like protein 1 n=1 Tax=Pangasianodon hypophthalmus TaxID=310915 RepID=UPI002307B9CE|nr:synaptotagmin-like protein 1 [Pangasianodon hypophthalmus]XP_053084452.1 synaptotagmin-like protein 1 [Pangasianodon hypophthalmus]XP_053084453.1 synaptotagmin-like protein 1 [Pangasianodon hypophthalmus]XP_053084454.1 synaptotagmin-like protein 1 [Pangasianodon hypophthalmus]XP_053084455.1 synaptotagmin-like protein 1 [Pangasianodon hypophthalmus]XP_053084456.1 synaptotagmin-like protein 1 [Pangasianodon hypophthalmus]